MGNKEDYRLAAVMFTDIYGFSRMMEADEKGTLDLLRDHNELIIGLVEQFNGNIIKTIGDAFLLDFRNTSDAVNCALGIQNNLFQYNQAKQQQLMLRIGIHLGDIWFFENDALGEVINIASRLQTLSRPGRICISHDVYHQIQNKVDVEIISLGAVKLKNISKEITAYEILTDFTGLEPESDRPARLFDTAGENAAVEETKVHTVKQIDDFDLERGILDRLEANGGRVSVETIRDEFSVPPDRLTGIMDRLTEKGVLVRVGEKNRLEYGLQKMWNLFKKRRKPSIQQKIRKKIEKARKNVSSWLPHLASFGAVNAFLFFINIMTSAHTLWFLYPLGGWAIGLFTHYSTVVSSRKQIQQLEKIPESITSAQYKLVDKLQKNDEGLAAHIGSYLSVNAFLLMVNLMTSSSHLWFLYPLLGWGVGFTIHVATANAHRRQILSDLAGEGYDLALLAVDEDRGANLRLEVKTSLDSGASVDGQSSYHRLLDQAERLKATVIRQVRESRKIQKRKATEIEVLLNDFGTNIRQLIQRDAEISGAIADASVSEIDGDLGDLRNKLAETNSETLMAEYRNSIQQLETYRQSIEELHDQKEVIYLRTSGALMSLKQLQLDLQKIEDDAFSREGVLPGGFEDKLTELSDYVRILQESYRDISV